MGGSLHIVAEIGGHSVPRSEVLEWEAGRATKVCKKLGITPPPGNLATQREALVARKLELGHEALERLLGRDLRLSLRGNRLITALSRGRRRLSTVELRGTGGSAEVMPGYYRAAMEAGDETALLAACPDHYVLCQGADGLQEVIETTGGSPLSARILLDETDTSTVTSTADPAFPIQWVAVGRGSADYPPSGAIRHQFRDEPHGGFRARLTVEWPIVTPPHLIRAHQWHLACEFSNWIEAANAGAA